VSPHLLFLPAGVPASNGLQTSSRCPPVTQSLLQRRRVKRWHALRRRQSPCSFENTKNMKVSQKSPNAEHKKCAQKVTLFKKSPNIFIEKLKISSKVYSFLQLLAISGQYFCELHERHNATHAKSLTIFRNSHKMHNIFRNMPVSSSLQLRILRNA
jgi:hypothetical protein